VLIAQHLPKPGAHLVTARIVGEKSLKAGSTREKNGGGSGNTVAACDKQLGNCSTGKWKCKT
jgi:hypothetical protein